ncbi:12017_t:CDS:2, partial [Dentiscutata heterogama]
VKITPIFGDDATLVDFDSSCITCIFKAGSFCDNSPGDNGNQTNSDILFNAEVVDARCPDGQKCNVDKNDDGLATCVE